MNPARRPGVAALAAFAVLVGAAALAREAPVPLDDRPNVILVVTDDQTVDTLPSDPPAMPWLQSQLADPTTGWLAFPQAIVSTPMCCPSRATLLTGLTADHHGVTSNEDGADLDETDTLPVWLHDAGYTTGLVGKYLNGYPWDGGPYVPPGWDRWFAKTNESPATTYYGYGVVDQGAWRRFGTSPGEYVTDVLGREAVAFVRSAPAERPWFLYLAPPAGHAPWIPAPRDTGLLGGAPPAIPSDAVLNDVEGKPAWVRGRPPIDDERAAQLQTDRVRARETLLSADEQLRRVWQAVLARGEQDRTVVVFLSDNGYQFGEHRWVGKQTPYEPSIRVPFAIRSPWVAGGSVPALVSNLDVAPTIVALAGVVAPSGDGRSLSALLSGSGPAPAGRAVPISWAGSPGVPAWTGVRTTGSIRVRWADGTVERYSLARDPDQLRNLRPALDPLDLGSG